MRRPPREAWTLARVLDALLMKMGRTACWLNHAVGRRQASLGTPVPRTPTVAPGPKARPDLASRQSQGSSPEHRGPQNPAASVDAWQLTGRGRLRFPLAASFFPICSSCDGDWEGSRMGDHWRVLVSAFWERGPQTCLPAAHSVAKLAGRTAHLHQQGIQDPREGPSLARRMTQDLLWSGLARQAHEERRYQGGANLTRLS